MSRRRRAGGAALLALPALLAACGSEYAGQSELATAADTAASVDGAAVIFAKAGDLTITHAVAPAPIGDRPAALYFTVRNDGTLPDTLVLIETPAAARAMVHEQRIDGGTMVMTPLPALPVPAGGTVRLAPGGLHVMVEERYGPLVAGDSLRVTLRFRRAGAVPLAAPVVSYADLEAHLGGAAIAPAAHDQHAPPALDTLPPAPARLEGRTAGAGGELALADTLWAAPLLDSLQRLGPRADSVTFALATPRLRVGERFDLRRALLTVLDSAGHPLPDAPVSLEVRGIALRVDGTTLVGAAPGEDTIVVRALLPAVRDSVAASRVVIVVQP